MLSTQADRNYGPPDGTQPEFDLLLRRGRFRDRAANGIGQFSPGLKQKSGVAGRPALAKRRESNDTS
jgi:hypothetical protein